MARQQCQGSSWHDPGHSLSNIFTYLHFLSDDVVSCFYFLFLQVFLGQNGVRDLDGNDLPRLVYVSREKRPGFDHHKKAGAMNALVSLLLARSIM